MTRISYDVFHIDQEEVTRGLQFQAEGLLKVMGSQSFMMRKR